MLPIDRFDIVVAPRKTEIKIVKRVIGMPGSTIAMKMKLFINGENEWIAT